jgi:hypothetical protein
VKSQIIHKISQHHGASNLIINKSDNLPEGKPININVKNGNVAFHPDSKTGSPKSDSSSDSSQKNNAQVKSMI